METRSLVSYDDIAPQPIKPPLQQQNSRQPPPKKRKRNHQKSKHRDDPRSSLTLSNYHPNGISGNGSSGSVSTQIQDEREASMAEEVLVDPDDYEEGRELTHEEIWDDSALVNAWEAATQEYEAYHGSEKAWKTETVNKAPL